MITFGICDDDIQYMRNITQIICEAYEAVKTIDESCKCVLYNSGKELIDNFIRDKIDIFILDIECGEMSGFDIARELLKRKKDLGIVYVTNYHHYVYEAYVCRPLGFIRKGSIKDDIKIPMINIVEFLQDKKLQIAFESASGTLKLYVNDIMAVEAFDHELKITLTEKTLTCKGPLSKYEKALEKYGFIKISRPIWVNRKYITRICGDKVRLCDKIEYIISRRRVKFVRESWGKGEE